MGTRAWNVDGDVSRYNTIPFAAARKAFLYYPEEEDQNE